MADPLRLLIVDDSRLFRAALEEALGDIPELKIVGSVFNGTKALEFIQATPPDLVTLDVEMPGIGGLETLRRIQEFNASRPGQSPVGAIMVSAFTKRGAQVTVDALHAGAFDFIAKPSAATPEENVAILRTELLAKVRAFAMTRGKWSSSNTPPASPQITRPPAVRRPGVRLRTRAIVIGTSTGGPRALSDMLPELCSLVTVPILIVQHMPANFTQSLAESLARQTGKTVSEATEGMPIQPASVYIAPGGKHLVVRGPSATPVAGLNEQPPENGSRPSADVLFRSAAALFGSELLAVILTGMGRDGTAGLGAVRRAGGYVIAQDEPSSVVWGMPGSAVEAGVVDEVVPLSRLARAITAVTNRAALP